MHGEGREAQWIQAVRSSNSRMASFDQYEQENSPSNINITRNRMFYARPDNGRRTSRLLVGLPSSRTLSHSRAASY